MANTINKYVWLINLLEAKGRLTHRQLSEEWMESGMSDEKQRDKGLSRKTVYNWRTDIAASLGVLIGCETKGRTYEYYLDYSDDTKKGVRDWLISTYSVCNQLIGSMEYPIVLYWKMFHQDKDSSLLLLRLCDRIVCLRLLTEGLDDLRHIHFQLSHIS